MLAMTWDFDPRVLHPHRQVTSISMVSVSSLRSREETSSSRPDHLPRRLRARVVSSSIRHRSVLRSSPVTTVVEVHDLRKRYRARDPWAVDGVSFALEAGQAFGLLGPNGAGKSTVVKMITGLARPDSGEISLFGSTPGDDAARAKIGFAPEEPDFPKFLRAAEVLDYFGRLLGLSAAERGRRIPEALEWAQLAGEPREVRRFSKGMKQRLGLAQAILARPELLIMDEPTADLDPLGRRDVRELIVGLKAQGTAILLNSHLLSEVERVCDRVSIMAKGRILREGPMREVVPEGRSLEEVFMELVEAATPARESNLPDFMTDQRPTTPGAAG
jgi:ABC-2 type transport system ATP-binding protein